MDRQHSNPLILIGGVTAAATTGALIAMGRRLGGAGVPFAAVGATLLHRTVSGAAGGLIAMGVLIHVAATLLWTAIFLRLVGERPSRAPWSAATAACGAFVLSWLVAWFTGAGIATVLPLGDRIVLALVFAGTLVVGMRFAFSSSQSA